LKCSASVSCSGCGERCGRCKGSGSAVTTETLCSWACILASLASLACLLSSVACKKDIASNSAVSDVSELSSGSRLEDFEVEVAALLLLLPRAVLLLVSVLFELELLWRE
jgi:hypothetical protein